MGTNNILSFTEAQSEYLSDNNPFLNEGYPIIHVDGHYIGFYCTEVPMSGDPEEVMVRGGIIGMTLYYAVRKLKFVRPEDQFSVYVIAPSTEKKTICIKDLNVGLGGVPCIQCTISADLREKDEILEVVEGKTGLEHTKEWVIKAILDRYAIFRGGIYEMTEENLQSMFLHVFPKESSEKKTKKPS